MINRNDDVDVVSILMTRHLVNQRIIFNLATAVIFAWVAFAIPMTSIAQLIEGYQDCGSIENHFGPYDYTNPAHRREYLPIVERFHFNDEVFNLISGMTARNPTGDITYTLHAFPNHHRALDALARLHRKHQTENMPGARYSLACYFDRASRMAPNDHIVLMLKAIHLLKTERLEKAEANFILALQLAPNSAEIHYNLGLLYLHLREYQSAREHATRAYELGFPLPGLRNKLISENQWDQGQNNEKDRGSISRDQSDN